MTPSEFISYLETQTNKKPYFIIVWNFVSDTVQILKSEFMKTLLLQVSDTEEIFVFNQVRVFFAEVVRTYINEPHIAISILHKLQLSANQQGIKLDDYL